MKTKNQTTIFSTEVHLQSVECLIDGKKQFKIPHEKLTENIDKKLETVFKENF